MTALPQDHVWSLSMTGNSLDIYTFLNTCSFSMWSWRHNNTALGQVRCRCTKTSFWIFSRCQSNEVSWREEPCHHSFSVHLWWGWGVNTLASQIYGGKKQVRFPGYLTVDGFPFPAVSSYGLIAAHSRLHYHQKHKLNVTCTKWLCSCSWQFCEVILVTVDKEEHRYLQSLQMCGTENHGGPCTAHFKPWLQKPVESRIRNYLACQHTHMQWRKTLM